MLITSIASSSSSMTVLNPVATAPMRAAATSTATTSTASNTVASSGSVTSPASTAAPARSGHGHASGGASASGSVAEDMQETSFSTTVGGTQYSGSVEESGGEYVATVSSLSGATASGASLVAAENNLTIRIDELV
jgi:hypothetical protein